jgi:hypothetical protein
VRRPLLALALLVGGLAVAAQQASTAGNALPATTTAVYRATTVTGATLVSLNYTTTAGQVTAVTPRLRGVGLLTSTVTAQFGSGTTVTCTAGLLTVLDVVTGLGEGDFTCLGLLERADRPRELRITAS